jgi:hypothetical protein
MMTLTREQFLKMSAGAAAFATVPILGTVKEASAAA